MVQSGRMQKKKKRWSERIKQELEKNKLMKKLVYLFLSVMRNF